MKKLFSFLSLLFVVSVFSSVYAIEGTKISESLVVNTDAFSAKVDAVIVDAVNLIIENDIDAMPAEECFMNLVIEFTCSDGSSYIATSTYWGPCDGASINAAIRQFMFNVMMAMQFVCK